MSFFGDVNVSVNGNRDVLKFMFTLNAFCFRTKSATIFLLLLCIMFFTHVSFIKLHPFTLPWLF